MSQYLGAPLPLCLSEQSVGVSEKGMSNQDSKSGKEKESKKRNE